MKKFNELRTKMPEEHQRRAKERTARYLGSIMTFAAWSASLQPKSESLRIALTQIADELGCAPIHNNEISEWEEGYFAGRAFELRSSRTEQKDGTVSN